MGWGVVVGVLSGLGGCGWSVGWVGWFVVGVLGRGWL